MNELSKPLRGAAPAAEDFIAKEEYVGAAFAAREGARLWPRVWQMACREEEISRVGDYVTYDIGSESIIVVRTAASEISAYHNVCQHRGRRLLQGCGHATRFFCRFHGWSWNLDGSNARVVDAFNWAGELKAEDIKLPRVRTGSWAGFVFINMDADAEPLEQFLDPLPEIFKNYQYQDLRYRWRKRVKIACNWKVALEAFDEGYHVQTTHRQLLPLHDDEALALPQGRHGMYVLAPDGISFGMRSPRLDPAPVDFRQNVHEFIQMMERDLAAITPPYAVPVTQRLLSELPEGASQIEVLMKYGALAHEAAVAAGVASPVLTPEEIDRAGTDWHVFPNMVFLPAPDGMLAYRARPVPGAHESCYFDIYSLVRYPADGAPNPAQESYEDYREHDNWGLILTQDFENMEEVQRGMRSSGFTVARMNPIQEKVIANYHRALREFIEN
jgi:nitrite reductase/ring-hydroxylating ferredoxin subunit